MNKNRKTLHHFSRGRLEKYCEKHGIDPQEIDYEISEHSNMEHLEELRHKTTEDYIHYAKNTGRYGEVDPAKDIVQKLLRDCWDIIGNYRQNTKEVKYKIGKRILQDEYFLKRSYGKNYFGELARKINEWGFGEDQLRKSVNFAKHAMGRAWLHDPNITWEWIRTEGLKIGKSIGTIKSPNDPAEILKRVIEFDVDKFKEFLKGYPEAFTPFHSCLSRLAHRMDTLEEWEKGVIEATETVWREEKKKAS